MGKILAICTSPRRGTLKTPVPSAVLTPEWGIVGDAHGGSWHRQVSLLSAEKIEAFRQKLWVDYGAFGENLVVEGFDLATLPVPSFFAIGDAVLEMTQIGKECHSDCAIRRQTGDCIMPREGVFARVVKGGTIHTGDEMKLLPTPADLPLRAAVITLSDKGSRGEREDKSGPLIVEMLTATGYKVEEALLLPDDAAQLKTQLLRLADARQVNLILTTGGTGFAPRDITPEVTLSVAERNAPGIAEAMRYHSLTITPRGMLSRGVSVLRGKTLIVNLPGSPKAVKENLEYILPSLAHGIRLAAGLDGECALTTGGTGFAPRDITPEVTLSVAERNAPGIAEAMRYHSLTITPRGMLSRGVSVLRGKTLIVNLPGSPKAVKENLEYILPSLAHGIRLAAGLDGECARK